MRNTEWFLMRTIIGSKFSSKVFQQKEVLLLIQFQGFCSGSAGTLKVNQSVHIA